MAALDGHSILSPTYGRLNDVYAYAKRDVAAGEPVAHAIGGDQFYGLVDRCEPSDAAQHVPIVLLEGEDGQAPRIVKPVGKDQPLTMDAVEFPDIYLTRAYQRQSELLAVNQEQANTLTT
jgi:predicted homoserine dehydrogenase-like protein